MEDNTVEFETKNSDLSEVMDTDVSGGTMAFIQTNAAAMGVFALAGVGLYSVVKWVYDKVKEKSNRHDKMTIKEKIQKKREKKKSEITKENES